MRVKSGPGLLDNLRVDFDTQPTEPVGQGFFVFGGSG